MASPAAGAYGRLVGRRLGQTVLTLLGLVTIVFLMLKMIPGDEAQIAAGADASPAQVEAMRVRLGLDAPGIEQYARFVGHALKGDFGLSIVTMQPVARDIVKVLPATIELVLVTLTLTLLLGLPAGVLAAARRGGSFDAASRIVAVLGGGLPAFWLGLMLQYLLGSRLHWLPISGQHGFGFRSPAVTGMPTVDALLAGNLRSFWDALLHILLPAFVLSLLFATQIFRTLRASMLAIIEGDFIAPVRAKGASQRRILLRHALPNALAPVLTVAGTQLSGMFGTAVLVETVFARQGVGSYLASAVAQKDTHAVLGGVIFVGVLICIVNLMVDVLHLLLDPRVRSAQLWQGA